MSSAWRTVNDYHIRAEAGRRRAVEEAAKASRAKFAPSPKPSDNGSPSAEPTGERGSSFREGA